MSRNVPNDSNIAFLGLGRMGAPMARNLVAAGYSVHAYDPAPDGRTRATGSGCHAADSAEDAVAAASVVITMLPDERAVNEVAFGEDGLVEGWRSGTLWVEMSSSLPATTRAVAAAVGQRDGALVDAPVSGGVRGAVDGTLTIMAAGNEEALARATPLLDALGSRTSVVGGQPGAGDVVKCLNNMLSAINLTAAAEAVAIAVEEGVDPRILVDVVGTSTGASNAMAVKVGRFALEGRFDTGFTIDQYLKDMRLALSVAADNGVSPLLASATRDIWRAFAEAGHGHEDHTRVVPLIADQTEWPRTIGAEPSHLPPELRS